LPQLSFGVDLILQFHAGKVLSAAVIDVRCVLKEWVIADIQCDRLIRMRFFAHNHYSDYLVIGSVGISQDDPEVRLTWSGTGHRKGTACPDKAHGLVG